MRVRVVRKHNARIKGAASTVLEATDMRNSVFRRRGILPFDRGSRGNGGGLWNKVGRSVVDGDGGIRWCSRGRPRGPSREGQHGEEGSSVNCAFHSCWFFINHSTMPVKETSSRADQLNFAATVLT